MNKFHKETTQLNSLRDFVPSCEPKAGNLRPMKPDIQHNPDVLTCLANLSSDEVFTPPKLANEMLDMLPAPLWRDKNATFLDPFSKSGVFLREIAKRLNAGLEKEIPDQQERVNHILGKQIFGIAITELTALISRRSLYCNKSANSQYSVATCFEDAEGNIRFRRTEHTWEKGRCIFCGASQAEYEREEGLETHAYEFIHTDKPEEIFNMKFDVIIGNPPYQMGSDGGTRDIPIYNKFVDQAKKMNPRHLSMVIPSRWMAGGLGLSSFREAMLGDRRITKLVDYERMDLVFPGVDFEGGVCYFLWERDSERDCEVTTVSPDGKTGPVPRKLNEFDVFVRDPRSLQILHKVLQKRESSITEILSVDKEFGWTSNFDGFRKRKKPDDVALYYNRKGKRLVGGIDREDIKKSPHLVDTWKVLVPQAYGERGARPSNVLGPSLIVPSPSVCTQTFLFFYTDTEQKAKSINSYLRTRFFRFMVSLRKITQHATRSTYTWVPQQTWDQTWTDAMLYEKYQLTPEEIDYIETVIRPMDPTDA